MKELISNAACHENMAFVLVPHLMREYKTQLPSILQKITNLQILEIQDRMPIRPCHFYVLPSGYYVRIANNHFVLDKRPGRGVNHSADVLFKSLAKEYGNNAIGVVLSGSAVGSDGSEGVMAIKKAGGHTYAQAPETCAYPDMPRLAIETGAIDSVLGADQIGHELSLVSWAEA